MYEWTNKSEEINERINKQMGEYTKNKPKKEN